MKGLIEKKNDLITRAEKILSVAKNEVRELTEDEAAELAEIRDNVRKIVETLKLNDDVKAMEKTEVKETEETEETKEEPKEERAIDIAETDRMAFENFLRGSIVHKRAGELTPATSGSNIGLGGKLIPETIVNYIIRKVYDTCPILARSQKFNVKGILDVPYYPADAQGMNVAYAEEFKALTSSSGSFDTVQLKGFLAGVLTKVSRSLINNTDFDIVGFVADEIVLAIKRFCEHECLIGTPDKITGLSTLTNVVTAASKTAITADEVVKLHDSIKDEFQQNAMWIMSPATRTALRLLKSQTGYYLLNDDVSTPFGVSILGKPVYVSDNMPDIAQGERVIFYGDPRALGTKFSEEINIEVLRERFADEHAYGVIGWLEFDAKVIDEQQMAVLKMAGTPASE